MLVGESANELHTLLNVVQKWCNEWGMYVKGDNTQIVHFRKPYISKAICDFVLGDQNICIVNKHKYVGLLLTESLDYTEMIQNRRRELWGYYCLRQNGVMPFKVAF